jgi:biopolymer transport protein ExbD
MKKPFLLILMTLSLMGCTVFSKKSSGKNKVDAGLNQGAGLNENRATWRTATLAGHGMSLSFPVGWHNEDESRETDRSEFSWRGPGNCKVSVSVSLYKPEYGNRSIEEETNSFYEDHKRGGSEDARLLEIDGVKGVHFRGDFEGLNEHYEPGLRKFIKWDAQRLYNQKRQIIFVDLSGPAENFGKDQDVLYGILQSIKFTQNADSPPAATTTADVAATHSVFVAIPSDNEIYVRSEKLQRVERARVAAEVDSFIWNLPEEQQTVYIKAAPDVAYGLVVSIIDDLRALGYDRFGFVKSKTATQSATRANPGSSVGSIQRAEDNRAVEQTRPASEDLLLVTIEIPMRGKIAAQIGGARVSLRELAGKVRSLLRDRVKKSVRIVAPAAMQYSSLLEVIEELQAGGAAGIEYGVKSP